MEGVRSEASGGNRSEERANDGEECRTKGVVVKSYDERRAADKMSDIYGPPKEIAKRPEIAKRRMFATSANAGNVVVVVGARGVAESLKRIVDAELTTMENPISCPPCKRKDSMSGGGDIVNEVS